VSRKEFIDKPSPFFPALRQEWRLQGHNRRDECRARRFRASARSQRQGQAQSLLDSSRSLSRPDRGR
jgi:hypothetical protein